MERCFVSCKTSLAVIFIGVILLQVESVLAQLSGEHDIKMKPFNFKMEEVEGFRYRAKDAWKAVTRIAIREARLKEIRQEIMNSQKLKVSHIPFVFYVRSTYIKIKLFFVGVL